MITYNALISACDKGKEPSLALKLFETMRRRGVVPCVVTYSALISACEKGTESQFSLIVSSAALLLCGCFSFVASDWFEGSSMDSVRWLALGCSGAWMFDILWCTVHVVLVVVAVAIFQGANFSVAVVSYQL